MRLFLLVENSIDMPLVMKMRGQESVYLDETMTCSNSDGNTGVFRIHSAFGLKDKTYMGSVANFYLDPNSEEPDYQLSDYQIKALHKCMPQTDLFEESQVEKYALYLNNLLDDIYCKSILIKNDRINDISYYNGQLVVSIGINLTSSWAAKLQLSSHLQMVVFFDDEMLVIYDIYNHSIRVQQDMALKLFQALNLSIHSIIGIDKRRQEYSKTIE